MAPTAEGTSTLIGVGIAVLANVLVCTALNLQRLAHLQRARRSDAHPTSSSSSTRGRSPARTQHERTPLIITTKPTLDRTLSDPEVLSRRRTSSEKRPRTDKGFLRSKLWLSGFACLNLGEFGNFLAYGFAPPSVVAPLGMVALIANVFLAPLIVREPFRRKDLVGVAIAVIGGATVVYASRSSDKKPTPDEFLAAISRPLFIAYAITSTMCMAVLAYLSETKLGDKYILIDLSLCALAGAFTVLSTKAISSFLNLMFLEIISYYITYPVLLVLAATALMQVNYVNKSLQRFESRMVIPTQYMTFALSTIVGSAILYRDFEGVALPSLVNFVFGCIISGAGVYLLTRDPPNQPNHSSRPVPLAPSPPSPLELSGPPPSLSHHSLTHAHGENRLVPVPLSPHARKLSLTLGGGYLLAGSPGALREEDDGERVDGRLEGDEEAQAS